MAQPILKACRNLMVSGLILLAQGMLGLSAQAGADLSKKSLHPSWRDDYRVGSGAGNGGIPNASFLYDLQPQSREVDLASELMEDRRVLEWRQQYDDINREYDYRMKAGLMGPLQERAYLARLTDLGNRVREEVEKNKINETQNRLTTLAEKDEALKTVATPAIIAAGIYVGRPVRMKVTDDTRLSLRTNIRDRFGALEVDSPYGLGAFEFRPQAPSSRSLVSATSVDFGDALNMQRAVDYSQERYQFSFSRPLPWLDLSSQVLYGASSNTVVGSLSKRLTENLTCVVDSIHWLSPYDSARVVEEKIRLKYDIRF